MAKSALSSETLLWVYNKKLVDKILGLGGYVVPVRRRILKVTFQYLVEHLIVIFCVEWRISTKPVRKRDNCSTQNLRNQKDDSKRERERERERESWLTEYTSQRPQPTYLIRKVMAQCLVLFLLCVCLRRGWHVTNFKTIVRMVIFEAFHDLRS